MSMTLILDFSIAFLLIATVIYCYKLNKRISLLHEGKDDLNSFIQDFNTAIKRAESNIDQLKTVGSSTDTILKDHIKKARFLANDLSFLMDKGEHVADNLERQIGVSRAITARPPVAAKRAARSSLPPKTTPTHVHAPVAAASVPPSVPKNLQNEVLAKQDRPNKVLDLSSPIAVSHDLPERAAAVQSAMTPSKKQALEDVLANIAVKKASVQKAAQTAQQGGQVDVPAEQKSGNVNPFDKRKLAQTLSSTQENS